MVKVNFNPSDFKRGVADTSDLLLKNRYFEQNPFLTDDGASLLARPGLRRWLAVGTGPIRGIFSEPGTFNGDVFVASGEQLYRVTQNGVATLIFTGLYNPERGAVNMAITGNIEDIPEYLYIADGRNLLLYVSSGFATGVISGTPANNDTVTLGTIYYKFTSGSVNAGTPAGTLANPWLVALGVNTAEAWGNFDAAIMKNGVAGTQYSTALTANGQANVVSVTGTSVGVKANLAGVSGNSIVTTETGASIAWTGATLSGGGSGSVTQVYTPDDVGVVDVAVSKSFVVVIPAQGQGINGRFYWIDPGETTIDPLNFATAESAPDPLYGVKVLGDQFWLPGQSTTETWYFTGDPTAPVMRLTGVVFDRGSWEGTAVKVKENMVIVDSDGDVFIVGGGIKKVSTPDIAERIRKGMQKQAAQTP